MRIAALLAMISALGGCTFSAPDDAYSVEEVLSDISSNESHLDGKVVSVRGWLGECGGTNCGIFQSLSDARKVSQYRTLPDEEWMPAFDRSLSIGGNGAFDQRAMFMQFSEVVITGEINATWKAPPDDSGMSFGCLDRCDDIRPQTIDLLL